MNCFYSRYEGEQQQRRDDEVAAIRKIETKKNIEISPIEKE